MKGSAEHPILWQKRNEWPINDDMQTDWQQMQSLLDTHMPVNGNAAGNGGGSSTGLTGGMGGIKLISAFFIALSAAAIIYYAVTHNNKSVYRDKQAKQQTGQATNIGSKQVITESSANPNKVSNVDPANTQGGNAAASTGNNTSTGASNINQTATGSGNTVTNGSNAGSNNTVSNSLNNKFNNTTTGKTASNSTPSKAIANNGAVSTTIGNNLTTLNNVNGKSSATPSGNVYAKTDKNSRGNSMHAAAPPIGNRMSNAVSTHGNTLIKNAAANSHNNNTILGSTRSNVLTGANTSGTKKGSYVKPNSGSRANILANHRHSGSDHKNYAKNGKSTNAGLNSNTVFTAVRANKNSKLHKKGDIKVADANTVKQPIAKDSNTLVPVMADNQPQYYGTTIDTVTPHFMSLDKSLKLSIKDASKNVQIMAAPTIKKPKDANAQKLELGILAGVNAPGSFTDKSLNYNFYGSLPVDAFLGVFANYTAYKNWGLNIQPKMLSPQTVSGTYSHIAVSKIDSGKTFVVTDSRKIYFIDVPLHVFYKATPNIRLMAGAAISFPVKDANSSALLVPNAALKDSAYYVKVRTVIGATKYSTQPSFGLSGGVSFYYWRLYLNATYLKAFKPQSISSDLGGYTFSHDALQFSLGIRLK